MGKEDGNLMDKKWKPVPKARAGELMPTFPIRLLFQDMPRT